MVTILSIIPPILFVRFRTNLDEFGQAFFAVENLATFLAPLRPFATRLFTRLGFRIFAAGRQR